MRVTLKRIGTKVVGWFPLSFASNKKREKESRFEQKKVYK